MPSPWSPKQDKKVPHGKQYEYSFLAFCFAQTFNKRFQVQDHDITFEDKKGGKFDDIGVKYSIGDDQRCFRTQLKHSETPDKNDRTIMFDDLKDDVKGAKVGLPKYFYHFLTQRRKRLTETSEGGEPTKLILLVNLSLNVQDLKNNGVEVREETIEDFLEPIGGKHYRLSTSHDSELGQLLSTYPSKILAETLASVAWQSDGKIQNKKGLLADRMNSLLRHVIDPNSKKFQDAFVSGKSNDNRVTLFRTNLKRAFLGPNSTADGNEEEEAFIKACERVTFSGSVSKGPQRGSEELPGDASEEELQHFFDKLILAVNQPNSDQIRKKILPNLMSANLRLPLSTCTEMVEAILKKVEELEDIQDEKKFEGWKNKWTYLKDSWMYTIGLVYRDSVTGEYLKKLCEFKLQFQASPADEKLILSEKQLGVVQCLPHCTLLGAVLLKQWLHNQTERISFVKWSILLSHPALCVFLRATKFDSSILVIEIDGEVGHFNQEKLSQLITSRIILVCSKEILDEITLGYEVILKDIGFPLLKEQSKLEIAELSVTFQEKSVSLLDMLGGQTESLNALGEEELMAIHELMTDDSVSVADIGPCSNNKRVAYYVDRSLLLCKPAVDIAEIHSGTFFVTGLDINTLRTKVEDGMLVQSFNYWVNQGSGTNVPQVQFIVEESKLSDCFLQNYETICKSINGNEVHWLRYVDDFFLFRSKDGANKNFVPLGRDKNIGREGGAILKILQDERLAVIADDGTMGKSTFLAHLAHTTSNIDPTRLVLLVDLKEVSFDEDCLQPMLVGNGDLMLSDALLKLLGFDQASSLVKFVLNAKFKCAGGVLLLFDNYDEVPPCHDCIHRLVKEVLSFNGSSVVIATRVHALDDLQQSLFCPGIPFSLKPLFEEDKVNLILRYWKATVSGNDDGQDDGPKEHAEEIVKVWSAAAEFRHPSLHDRFDIRSPLKTSRIASDGDLLGSPLLLRLLAEIHSPCEKGSADCALLKNGKPGLKNLFDAFLQERTLKLPTSEDPILADGKEIAVHEATECMKKLAFEMMCDEFPKYKTPVFKPVRKSMKKETSSFILRLGIITDINPKIKFLHRAFGEYFAAYYMCDQFKYARSIPNFTLFLFGVFLVEKHLSLSRKFLDIMLGEAEDTVLNGALSEALQLVNFNFDHVSPSPLGREQAVFIAILESNLYIMESILQFLHGVNCEEPQWQSLFNCDFYLILRSETNNHGHRLFDGSGLSNRLNKYVMALNNCFDPKCKEKCIGKMLYNSDCLRTAVLLHLFPESLTLWEKVQRLKLKIPHLIVAAKSGDIESLKKIKSEFGGLLENAIEDSRAVEMACVFENWDCAKWFIENGGDPIGALNIAHMSQNGDMIQWLERKVPNAASRFAICFFDRSSMRRCVAHDVCQESGAVGAFILEDPELFESLLKKTDVNIDTILHSRLTSRNLLWAKALKCVLQYVPMTVDGGSLDIFEEPLQSFVNNPFPSWERSGMEIDNDFLKTFFSKRCSLWQAACFAIILGKADLVKELVKKGVDRNRCLEYAILFGNKETIQSLARSDLHWNSVALLGSQQCRWDLVDVAFSHGAESPESLANSVQRNYKNEYDFDVFRELSQSVLDKKIVLRALWIIQERDQIFPSAVELSSLTDILFNQLKVPRSDVKEFLVENPEWVELTDMMLQLEGCVPPESLYHLFVKKPVLPPTCDMLLGAANDSKTAVKWALERFLRTSQSDFLADLVLDSEELWKEAAVLIVKKRGVSWTQIEKVLSLCKRFEIVPNDARERFQREALLQEAIKWTINEEHWFLYWEFLSLFSDTDCLSWMNQRQRYDMELKRSLREYSLFIHRVNTTWPSCQQNSNSDSELKTFAQRGHLEPLLNVITDDLKRMTRHTVSKKSKHIEILKEKIRDILSSVFCAKNFKKSLWYALKEIPFEKDAEDDTLERDVKIFDAFTALRNHRGPMGSELFVSLKEDILQGGGMMLYQVANPLTFTVFDYVASLGRWEKVFDILSKYDSIRPDFAVPHAAWQNEWDIVERLVCKGAHPELAIVGAAKHDKLDFLAELVLSVHEKPTKYTFHDDFGMGYIIETPNLIKDMHIAAMHSHWEDVYVLTKNGVNSSAALRLSAVIQEYGIVKNIIKLSLEKSLEAAASSLLSRSMLSTSEMNSYINIWMKIIQRAASSDSWDLLEDILRQSSGYLQKTNICAVWLREWEFVETFIQQMGGSSCLSEALVHVVSFKSCPTEEKLELVKKLLELGADPRVLVINTHLDGLSELMLLLEDRGDVRKGVIQSLAAAGKWSEVLKLAMDGPQAVIDLSSINPCVPIAVLEALLNLKAITLEMHISFATLKGECSITPSGCLQHVQQLMSGGNWKEAQEWLRHYARPGVALSAAYSFGKWSIAKELISFGIQPLLSLELAAKEEDWGSIRRIVDYGCDVNVAMLFARTPDVILELVREKGANPNLAVALAGALDNLEAVSELVDLGADIDIAILFARRHALNFSGSPLLLELLRKGGNPDVAIQFDRHESWIKPTSTLSQPERIVPLNAFQEAHAPHTVLKEAKDRGADLTVALCWAVAKGINPKEFVALGADPHSIIRISCPSSANFYLWESSNNIYDLCFALWHAVYSNRRDLLKLSLPIFKNIKNKSYVDPYPLSRDDTSSILPM